MKSKNIFLICMFICSLQHLNAFNSVDSTRPKKPFSFKDKITFNIGGGILLGSAVNVSLLPQIGYRITPKFTAGIGANLQYYKIPQYSPDPIFIYGGNGFLRYNVLPEFFVQTEYQLVQYASILNDYVLAGAGYINPGNFFIAAFYIIKQPPVRSIYNTPYTLRVGFLF